MSDPFERARLIREGKLDNERPDYDEMTGWIQRFPATMLPGLLSQCVYACVAEDCFVEGGLAVFVARAEQNAKHQESVLRKAGNRDCHPPVPNDPKYDPDERPFSPKGIQFIDAATNRVMRLVTEGVWKDWLVYLHPDGQWVSLRMTTADDRERIAVAAMKEQP